MAAGHEHARNRREIVQKATQKKYETKHKKRLLPGGNFAEHIKGGCGRHNSQKYAQKKKQGISEIIPAKTCLFRGHGRGFFLIFLIKAVAGEEMNKERTKRNRQQRACYFEFIDTIRAGEPPAAMY